MMMTAKTGLAVSALVFALAIWGSSETAKAQRSNSIKLLSLGCLGGQHIRASNQDVAINKQLFTEQYYWETYANGQQLTCRLDRRKRDPKETLRLRVGASDYENLQIDIVIYLDGVQVDQFSLSPGNMITKLYDISKYKNIAINLKNATGGGNLHVFAAEIIPGAISEVPTESNINISAQKIMGVATPKPVPTTIPLPIPQACNLVPESLRRFCQVVVK